MTAPAQPEQPPDNLHARIYRAVYTSPAGAAVEAVLAAVQPDLDALRAEVRTLTAVCKSNKAAYVGAVADCQRADTELAALRERYAAQVAENQRLRDELAAVDDELTAQHQHNDRTCSAVAERDQLRALHAQAHAAAYHQGEPRDNHSRCTRDGCPGTDEPAAPRPTT